MALLQRLSKIWEKEKKAFLIYKDQEIYFKDVYDFQYENLHGIHNGDVVALIGDYDPRTISCLLKLIDLKTIIVPLTNLTTKQHDQFFDVACVDFVIQKGELSKRIHNKKNDKIDKLRKLNHAGLIAFSSGTTSSPKAILHDLSLFLSKFSEPQKSLKTLNFLLFDHVGGLNTLFYSLFNKGTTVIPSERTVDSVIHACTKHEVELLPTTPTFLRMLLMSGCVPETIPSTLKIISYGTEIMDELTLTTLCKLLPQVDFRQTYGVSELGVMSIKSEARSSLFFKIGGYGVKTRVENNVLQIKTAKRMIGYLNSPSPFDKNGWYNTRDIVQKKNGLFKIIGRDSDIINVSGLKFMASDVERVVMGYKDIFFARVIPKNNPITGQHCEIKIQPINRSLFDVKDFKVFMSKNLQPHMIPRKITLEDAVIGHRLKRK